MPWRWAFLGIIFLRLCRSRWDYIAKGDIAEGSTIEIETIPATVSCRDCGTIYEVDVSDIANANCPECGCPTGKLVTGRELRIVGIEIE